MTNAEIIANAKLLANIQEEIHTFAHWKSIGFQVKKGEHAIIQISIWKFTNRTVRNSSGEERDDERMFLKKSAFFGESQVEPIT